MTFETVANIVSLFYRDPLPPELFADYASKANMELFLQRWAEKDKDALRKFYVEMGQDTVPLHFTNGIASLPSDYFAEESAYYRAGTDQIRVNFVEPRVFDILSAHAIEPPSMQYPIGTVLSSYVKIRPVSIRFVHFTYLSSPEPVVYAVTTTRGYPEFDEANSSTLMWNAADTVVLIQLILQSLNIQVSKSEIQNKIDK